MFRTFDSFDGRIKQDRWGHNKIKEEVHRTRRARDQEKHRTICI